MIEADRVLRPLREAEPAIERLDSYESPVALTEALRATWQAVERTLRTLLRSDASAPDDVRLTAMSSDQMNTDTVLTELRRRDLVSLELAGRVHELRQAVERADRGQVRAADADVALNVVRTVTTEVYGLARQAPSPERSQRVQTPVPVVGDDEFDEADVIGYGAGRIPLPRGPLIVAGLALLILIVALVAVLTGGESGMEQGIAAFRDDRHAVAEEHFRGVLEQDADNATARLYLARILRGDGRTEEADRVLRAAAAASPEDAGVRRELGYLLLDLEKPDSAALEFQRAVELDPDDPLNWVGVVEALNRAGDAAASEWIERAPAEARAMIEQRKRSQQ